jgi:hypothetical protein
MKRINTIFVFTVMMVLMSYQSFSAEFSAGADIMSRYIWRGADYGNSPSIQPTLEFSTGGFAVGTWGAFSIDTDVYQELDLYMSYSFGELLTIGVTDYFFPVYQSSNAMFSNKYFDYENETTGHILEGNLTYNCMLLPVYLSANVAFYGADKNEDGDNNFSTYIELGHSGTLNDVGYSVFMGITPGEGLYGDTFGVVNLGLTATKEIKFSETFSLPVTSGLIFNPQNENAFFVFGFSL